jgi:hypothetical protein
MMMKEEEENHAEPGSESSASRGMDLRDSVRIASNRASRLAEVTSALDVGIATLMLVPAIVEAALPRGEAGPRAGVLAAFRDVRRMVADCCRAARDGATTTPAQRQRIMTPAKKRMARLVGREICLLVRHLLHPTTTTFAHALEHEASTGTAYRPYNMERVAGGGGGGADAMRYARVMVGRADAFVGDAPVFANVRMALDEMGCALRL